MGQWIWQTYPSSYIYRADFSGLYQLVDPNYAYSNTLFTGVYSTQASQWEQPPYHEYGNVDNPNVVRSYTASSDNNIAVFGMQTHATYVRNGGPGLASLGKVTLYLGDRHPPTVSASEHTYDGRWTNQPTAETRLIASDSGLGLKAVGVARTDRGDPNAVTVPDDYWLSVVNNAFCQGNRRATCLTSFDTATSRDINGNTFPNGKLTYRLDVLPEGANTVRASAHQYEGNQYGTAAFTPGWTARRDVTAPVVAASGALWNARDTTVRGDQDLAVSVTASDGSLSSPATQRSGATSLAVTMNGEPITGGSLTQACTRTEGSCSLTVTPTLTAARLAELGPGDYTVEARATDALGHTSAPLTWTFQYDPDPPTVDLDDDLASVDQGVLTEGSYRFTAQALDTNADVYGSGLRDLVIRLDGQTVPTSAVACFAGSSCESARAWDWDTTPVANGPHVITVTAADQAGNVTVETIDVDLRRINDRNPRASTAIRRTVIGAALGDRAGSAVSALGDLNGDDLADYAIGAPGAGTAERPGAGKAYIVLGSASSNAIDLAAPPADVLTIVGPGSGSYCGTAVANAGDVNGDGLADLLVGCPGLDPALGAVSATGRAYVVFGTSTPSELDLATLGQRGFAITGPQETLVVGLPTIQSRPAVFGERLQGTPLDADAVSQDINGDGLADLVFGDSAVARNGQSNVGAAYVVFGKADSSTVDVTNLAERGFTILGDRQNALTGYSAAVVGDLNDDTLSDIVIGSPGNAGGQEGSAHIVYGTDATTTVDLADSVRLTSGTTGDRFGAGVASIGDTNLDGRADFAIATSSGGYVVRTAPSSSRTISSSDGYAISGPVNDPGLLPRVPEAPIAPAGDIDNDGRADLIIGYPDAPAARAYTIASPERSRTLEVMALPGQRGTSLSAGTREDRSGAAVAANPAQGEEPLTESAQAILGSPNRSDSSTDVAAGVAYLLGEIEPPAPDGSSFRARISATGAAPRCDYISRLTPYRFEVGPNVRYGYRVPIDPATGQADYGDSEAILPLCRTTGRKRPDQVPAGYRKLTGEYEARPFTGAVNSNKQLTAGIYDSFGILLGQIRQTIRVSTRTGKRSVTKVELLDAAGAVKNTKIPKDLAFSVQGYACYVAGPRTDKVMVAYRAVGASLRGFINRDRLNSSLITNKQLVERGDTGCASNRGLAPTTQEPLALTGLDSSYRYQGKSSAFNDCRDDYTRSPCGARYDTYEPDAAFGPRVVVAQATTGITGGADADSAGGGIAIAVVRTVTGRRIDRIDRIGYNDPNVSCNTVPAIRWYFGNANPGKGKRGIYGWLPEITATSAPARACPPPKP